MSIQITIFLSVGVLWPSMLWPRSFDTDMTAALGSSLVPTEIQSGPGPTSDVRSLVEKTSGSPLFWASLGIGASDLGPVLGLTGHYLNGRMMYGLDLYRSGSYEAFALFPDEPYTELLITSIIVGRVMNRDTERHMFIASAGLSYANITRNLPIPGSQLLGSAYSKRNIGTIGLPLGFRWCFPTQRGVGMDLGLRVDLSTEVSSAAIIVGLRLGRMKAN